MPMRPEKAKSKREGSETHAIVDLTISGASLDPEGITVALDMSPDRSMKRGHPYGILPSDVGYWGLEGRPASGCPEMQIRSILERINPIMDRLRRVMTEEKTIEHVILTIGLMPARDRQVEVISFDSDLINAFTSLGIDIALALYLF